MSVETAERDLLRAHESIWNAHDTERTVSPFLRPLREQVTALSVAVRSTVDDPNAVMPAVRAALRELDPELPVYGVQTMEDALARSMAQRALYSWLMAVFAALSLVLALGGTYDVTPTSFPSEHGRSASALRWGRGDSTSHVRCCGAA